MQEVKYKLFAHIALTKVYGFREVGYRKRISQMNGVLRNVILMERRSKIVGMNNLVSKSSSAIQGKFSETVI